MKNNTLLLLASLVVLTTTVSAAPSQLETDLVVLPTYVVEALRHQPVQQHIDASLNKLRQQASAPITITPDLTTLKARIGHGSEISLKGQDMKPVSFAKL